MKAEELRIGNILNWQIGSTVQQGIVTSLSTTSIVIDHKTTFKPNQGSNYYLIPIPLTEDWLKKFGFKAGGIYDNYKLNGMELDSMFRTVDTDERSMFYLSGEIPTSMKISITYVHQLQNIFHALTGQELTIKSDNQ